jgi:GTP-binding protein
MNAVFIKSAASLSGMPAPDLPEVAFTGRSNVGKSSFINKLVGRKNLVKTGKTPGKTRLLNFFSVQDRLIFTDLPGYGYAAVSKAEKSRFIELIEGYLLKRKNLKLCFILMDIRRSFQSEERDIIELMAEREVDARLALTKADKLSKSAAMRERNRIAREAGIAAENLIPFSSITGEGCEQVWKIIDEKIGRPLEIL